MDDVIYRKDVLELLEDINDMLNQTLEDFTLAYPTTKICEFCRDVIKDLTDDVKEMPSAEPKRKIYANMSDEEFERWLYEHGICNPNIHESIPCDAVPLLIDNAINELPSAQSEIIRCKDCKHNPKESWFGCPMSHLSEKQLPETAWCWKGKRKDENQD